MGPRRARVIRWLVILASGLALPSVLASAQGNGGNSNSRADSTSARSGRYADACSQGNARYAKHDFPGAIAYYRGATELDPKNPMAYYLLGEAWLAAGNVAEAEVALNRASLESSEKDPAMRARILFVVADLKERQWKWDDARSAWQVYIDWTGRFPNSAAFPASARSRQRVIDAMLQQDKAYEAVRRRITETSDGGVFTDLSKSPPDASK
jgi:tetratricopeptide (TPR) repeat protein